MPGDACAEEGPKVWEKGRGVHRGQPTWAPSLWSRPHPQPTQGSALPFHLLTHLPADPQIPCSPSSRQPTFTCPSPPVLSRTRAPLAEQGSSLLVARHLQIDLAPGIPGFLASSNKSPLGLFGPSGCGEDPVCPLLSWAGGCASILPSVCADLEGKC